MAFKINKKIKGIIILIILGIALYFIIKIYWKKPNPEDGFGGGGMSAG